MRSNSIACVRLIWTVMQRQAWVLAPWPQLNYRAHRHLPTKVHLVKAMVSPVVMYRCESWTIKKAEHRRTDAFELWCWRRLLRIPCMERRSNQSILKEISPEYSLEGLVLKLKLQYFGHLMWRTDSLEKTLMLGKIEGGRRRGWQRMRWLDGIANSVDTGLTKLQELQRGLACCSPRVAESRTWLSDWTELNWNICSPLSQNNFFIHIPTFKMKKLRLKGSEGLANSPRTRTGAYTGENSAQRFCHCKHATLPQWRKKTTTNMLNHHRLLCAL